MENRKELVFQEILYDDGEECDHSGCKSHVTHPCEKCGRKQAIGCVYKPFWFNGIFFDNPHCFTKFVEWAMFRYKGGLL
jgi:hypothetical protein